MTLKKESAAHWVRRLIHVCMIFVPLIYYAWGKPAAHCLGLSLPAFVACLIALVVFLESARLKHGGLFFGQRPYERHQVSAVAWGAISLLLVCFFSQGIAFSVPIVGTCALADPLMGEMRRHRCRPAFVAALGLVFAYLVWIVSWWCLGTPWLLVLICPLIAISVEYPRLRWIDDNALMMLVPLLFVLLV